MSIEKKSFRDSNIYPVVFMLIVTILFVGVLSTLYRSTEKGIETRKQQLYRWQVLSLFADTISAYSGIDKVELLSMNKLNENYNRYIIEIQLQKSKGNTIKPMYYKAINNLSKEIGYCFDIKGSGLWGTMRGLIAVTPDFAKILNFAIYEQMETPGLGARIEETWFKAQFSKKPLITGKTITYYTLVPEEAQPGATEIKQITGATITSSSVLKMIQSAALELSNDFVLQAK